MLCTLNLKFVCQLYLNKTRRKKKKEPCLDSPKENPLVVRGWGQAHRAEETTVCFKEKRNLLQDLSWIPKSVSGGTRDPNMEATQPGLNLKATLRVWPQSHRSPLSQHT